jgi:hypothetical protein
MRSYLQIFRDGSLEYGDTASLFTHGGDHIASQVLEENVMMAFANALGLLKELEVVEPVFVTLTLTGVKGRTMALPPSASFSGYMSQPFDRDVILCPDMLIENLTEGYPYPSTLLPIVDALWQAAGREKTPYLNSLWKPGQ